MAFKFKPLSIFYSNALRDQTKLLQDLYVMPSAKDPLRKSVLLVQNECDH